MDVANYIGLFLLKNHFCYIHGLGNLELKKRPATYDGSVLQPPSYEVVVTPAGSIDDNLANFIATNEQISISKASNELREYSTRARHDLQEGKDVPIPHLGKFVEGNGKIHFVTDKNFQYAPPSIPAMRISRRMGDTVHEPPPPQQQSAPAGNVQPYEQQETAPATVSTDSTGTINWVRVALAALVLIAVCAGAFFAFKYYKSHKRSVSSAATSPADTSIHQPVAADSTQMRKDTSAISSISADSLKQYKMILDIYTNKKKAQQREQQMKSYGHDVYVVDEDSATHLIIMNVRCRPADTARMIDSLARLYNPSGVSIY